MHEPTYLRGLEVSDVDRIYKWHNDSGLYEMLCGPFHFVSKQAVQAWLDRKTAFSSFSSDEVNLAICVKESNKHIGNIYLRRINWVFRNAVLEIFIGDSDERSKGYGQSAIRQLLSYAFGDLGLKRIYLEVLDNNNAGLHIYEKFGFRIEGTLKNHIFKQGGWKDMILMGICSEDYSSCKE